MANVELKWAKEVKHFCGKKCPIILVANKIDIRTDQELLKELETDHIVSICIRGFTKFGIKQGGVKATVSGVVEDLKFKISEGLDPNWCFPDSAQLAVSV